MKLILLFFVGVALFQLGVAEEKVDFIMVMKSGCPPCRKFIAESLYPNVRKFMNYIDLKLWTKGYAYVDDVIACLENDVDKQLSFANCFSTTGYIQPCIDDYGIDREALYYCIDNEAYGIIKNNEKKSDEYGIKTVPSIIFNSTFETSYRVKLGEDFDAALCEMLDYPQDICVRPSTKTAMYDKINTVKKKYFIN